MTLMWLPVIILVVIVVLALALRKLLGCSCMCGRRMARLDELPEADRREILRYFENVEKRTPDAKSVFVCHECRKVYDDFSGERKSMQADHVFACKVCGFSLGQFPVVHLGAYVVRHGRHHIYQKIVARNQALVERIECLRCRRRPRFVADCLMCDASPKVLGCSECGTVYMWTEVGGSTYKFFVPLTTQEVLREGANPMSGGWNWL